MGFRSISVEEKIAVIYEVTKKGKIEPEKGRHKICKVSLLRVREGIQKWHLQKERQKGFFDKLKQDEQKEESVQGSLCPWCGKSFHVEKKGASTLT